MNEIETTLESAPAPRSTTRRSVARARFERSENGDAMPLLLTVDDAADLLRTTRRAIYAMLERRQLPARSDSHPSPCLDPLGRTVRVARPEARVIAEE